MDRRLASLLVVVGGGLIGISLLADGLGFGNRAGFGEKQLAGALVGCAIISLGLLVMRKAP